MSEFTHQQAAHCESGVMAALLRDAGLEMSEPMAFGLSAAISFAYIPMIKLGGLPLISYRMPPGYIVKKLGKRLNLPLVREKYSNAEKGMQALDNHINAGRKVGLQTSVYWLPYFPPDMRFHFNAHNLVVYGKENDNYLISDPTFEDAVQTPSADLKKARFVKGPLAPKGHLYYLGNAIEARDLKKPAEQAVFTSAKNMLFSPVPIVGNRGLKRVAKKVQSLEKTPEKGKLFIGHMVRMQEEIGTGGGGFRFLHASFLQELAQRYHHEELANLSNDFTDIGDEWRRYALFCAKMIKDRMPLDYTKLADQLNLLAQKERDAFYKQLKIAKKGF